MSTAAGIAAPHVSRRAERGASVLSAADVGGLETYARSLHGQHFRPDGYGAPVVMNDAG